MTPIELQITDAELIAALRAELAAAHRRADEAEQRLIQTDRPCPSAKVCAGLQGEVEAARRGITPRLSSAELKLADRHCDWNAFQHAFSAVMKSRGAR